MRVWLCVRCARRAPPRGPVARSGVVGRCEACGAMSVVTWLFDQPDGPATPARAMWPVRVFDDPLVGTVLAVAGSSPAVMRVTGGTLTGLTYEGVEGEFPASSSLWPETVPPELHGYREVVLVAAAHLRTVDVLRIVAGSSTVAGTRSDRHYLWQARASPQLAALTNREVRRALASAWVRGVREATTSRGIALRD